MLFSFIAATINRPTILSCPLFHAVPTALFRPDIECRSHCEVVLPRRLRHRSNLLSGRMSSSLLVLRLMIHVKHDYRHFCMIGQALIGDDYVISPRVALLARFILC